MYRKNDGQISIAEFLSPFGKLDETNRWVKKAKLIPWDRIEETYARLFESDTGNVAKPVRMALGSLLIKQETGLSDEGVVQNIVENPYMQYFIGLLNEAREKLEGIIDHLHPHNIRGHARHLLFIFIVSLNNRCRA